MANVSSTYRVRKWPSAANRMWVNVTNSIMNNKFERSVSCVVDNCEKVPMYLDHNSSRVVFITGTMTITPSRLHINNLPTPTGSARSDSVPSIVQLGAYNYTFWRSSRKIQHYPSIIVWILVTAPVSLEIALASRRSWHSVYEYFIVRLTQGDMNAKLAAAPKSRKCE